MNKNTSKSHESDITAEDDLNAYNRVAKYLHWIIGIAFIALLVMGVFMSAMPAAPFKFKLYGIHKSIGIIILFFAVFLTIWRFSNARVQGLETHKKWEKTLAKIAHVLLYVAMFAMPLSGWVMSSAGGYAVSIFGWFEMPSLMEKNKEIGKIANQIHTIAGKALIALVALHIIGALKHHIIDKDITLQRMSSYGRASIVAFGVGVLALILFMFTLYPLIIGLR